MDPDPTYGPSLPPPPPPPKLVVSVSPDPVPMDTAVDITIIAVDSVTGVPVSNSSATIVWAEVRARQYDDHSFWQTSPGLSP